jgi:beta-lactamase superfamily II metal-dependent hydrolase
MVDLRRMAYVAVMVSLVLSLLLAGTAAGAPATRPLATAAGEVVINEVVPAPQTVFTQEKLELYNTTENDLAIGGMWLDDIAGGGGAPYQIPAGTIIPANGFWVWTPSSSYFNNGGDDVRLLAGDGTTVLDSYTYSATPGYDASYYRCNDGGAWATTPDTTPTIGAPNDLCANGGSTPAWTPGAFAIYIFDVDQGDSQLIVSPSGKTLLIDLRENSYQSGAGAALIASKLHQAMGPSFNHLDYIMASHLHLDHIGYAGYGGIWGLIETQGFTVGKLIDRDAGVWVDSDGNGVCNPDTEIVWHNVGTTSGTARNWLCYVTNPANANKLHREIAQIGSTTQIDLGPGTTVTIEQRDAENVMMADGVTPLRGDHSLDALPPSENDYSIGIKVRYGIIDYATAGDSDGEYSTSSFSYTYNNVEAVLAPRMGVVDVLRANHHGSEHSTSQLYADTLQPHSSFISCGTNSYGHPGQTTLDRLLFWGSVYVTNLCDTTRNYGAAVIVNGDIVLVSSDGVNYTINGTPFVATDPVTATSTPTPLPTNTPTPLPTNTPTPLPTNTPTPTPTNTRTPTPLPTNTPTPTPTPITANFLSIAAEDGYLLESSETSNIGGSLSSTGTTVRAGDDASDRQWRSILSFDTSSLPDNAIILSVQIRLQRSGVTGTSPFDTHGALWVDVNNGPYGESTTLAISDFEAASTATQVASLSNPLVNGDWASGSLNSAGLAAINKLGRTQFKLRFNLDDNDDLSGDYMGFNAGEATSTSRPVLVVTYRLP